MGAARVGAAEVGGVVGDVVGATWVGDAEVGDAKVLDKNLNLKDYAELFGAAVAATQPPPEPVEHRTPCDATHERQMS